MRAIYSTPEGSREPERKPAKPQISDFERIRDQRFARCLQSLKDALIMLGGVEPMTNT
jgi:hypothetical protein